MYMYLETPHPCILKFSLHFSLMSKNNIVKQNSRTKTKKEKNDHRSIFTNLNNWKEEAWKKSGVQRPRHRCNALPTEL